MYSPFSVPVLRVGSISHVILFSIKNILVEYPDYIKHDNSGQDGDLMSVTEKKNIQAIQTVGKKDEGGTF